MEVELMPMNRWTIPEKSQCSYTSCYCEENVWKLCEAVRINKEEAIANYYVVFISNKYKSVPLWKQQSGHNEEKLAIWDYHVILISTDRDKNLVYDLDTILNFPVEFSQYSRETLRNDFMLKSDFHRMFRVIPALQFLDNFSSDRSHMLKQNGEWSKSPPPFPPIQIEGVENNLQEFISMDKNGKFVGEVIDLNQFNEKFNSL